MTTIVLIIAMMVLAALAGWAKWRETHKIIGEVPIVAPGLVFYVSLIIFIVLAANLIEHLTGVPLKSIFSR